jgi:uncharacterized protein (TIGR02284 family)
MTTTKSTETIQTLDRLLVLCADGVEGYRHAAKVVPEPSIHRVLASNAAAREETVSVLTYALVSLGYKPSHHASIPGALHRTWVDAIGALKPHATLTILHECERGEQRTLEGFTSALGRSLPEEIHSVVQSQLGRILEASAALQRAIAEATEKPSSAASAL